MSFYFLLFSPVKFKNITSHPWYGLTEDKNNPFEIRESKKSLTFLKDGAKKIEPKKKSTFKFK